MSSLINRTILQYRIIEQIGCGGMGEVYKAEDLKLKRIVALKFLPFSFNFDEDAKKRFVREAQSASALDHPNICTIHEIGESEDGRSFICMSYYEGQTVKDLVSKESLEINRALEIILQICNGLIKAHNNNIVHRDIKPGNIFLTNEGTVKILDFGLAKIKGQTRLTQIGTTAGTVNYMSPEQTRGEEVDQRTDIWSLGIVLYEMITGEKPFKADYDQAVIYSILNDEPDISKIPGEFKYIIKKTLAKSLIERYQNVEEIVNDLKSFGNKSDSIINNTPRGNNKKNLKTNVIAIAVSVFICAVITFLYFNQSPINQNSRTVTHRKMIVVLPFENLGPPKDEYFAMGMREEISNKLASYGNLGVISRSSAEKFANSHKTAKEIGKELGVDYILEGTLQWANGKSGRVRIIPQLIRASDDINIWSESYDRINYDIFDLQNEIAKTVAAKLDVRILPGKSINGAPPTKNIDAYDYYLKALRIEYNGTNNSDFLKSIELYKKAIKLDSEFAAAHAQISIAYLGLYSYGGKDVKYLEKISEHLKKSIALNPNLAEVHLAQGLYYYFLTNEEQLALMEFKKVLEIQPNNAEAVFGISAIYWREGKYDLDLKYTLMAFSLDPMIARYAHSIGNSYNIMHEYKKAEKYFKLAIKLSPASSLFYVELAENYIDWKGNTEMARQVVKNIKNNEYLEDYYNIFIYLDILDRNFNTALKELKSSKKEYANTFNKYIPNYLMIALLYNYKKEYNLSKAYFDSSKIKVEKMLQNNPDDYRLHLALSMSYAGMSKKSEAIKENEKAMALISLNNVITRKYTDKKHLAKIYTLVGDYKNALKEIDFLLSTPNSAKLSINILKLDPIFDPLRNLAGYHSIIAKYSNLNMKNNL